MLAKNLMTYDVVFVTPSYAPSLDQESIGTLILAKKLELAGYSIRIVRFWEASMKMYDDFKKDICEKILSTHPKIVSFYCRGIEYHIMVDLARELKSFSSNLYILFGGPQAELVGEETLNQFLYVDFVCCGEGENTIVPLVDSILEYKSTLDRIPGLMFRNENGNVIKNQYPTFIPDNYYHDYNYYNLIPKSILLNSQIVTIDVGRGCPFACTFCSTKSFWKQKFRLRNLRDILIEIDYVKNNFGNKIFSFSHDLFTANKYRVIDFCNIIESIGYSIKWTCSSRVDCIDYETIDRMVSSGLVGIYYGIETGSSRIQKLINKNINIQHCIDIVNYSTKKKITVITSFIYGFPEETEEDLEQTFILVHKLMSIGADVQLHSLQFERGTLIFEKYRDCLIFSRDCVPTTFGVDSLMPNIKKNLDLFSVFGDYPSQLRNNIKHLNTLHSICKIYPKSYVALFELLISKGFKYTEIYMLLIFFVKDSLVHFEEARVNMTKSISVFIYETMISKLLNYENCTLKIIFSTSELNILRNCIPYA